MRKKQKLLPSISEVLFLVILIRIASVLGEFTFAHFLFHALSVLHLCRSLEVFICKFKIVCMTCFAVIFKSFLAHIYQQCPSERLLLLFFYFVKCCALNAKNVCMHISNERQTQIQADSMNQAESKRESGAREKDFSPNL